jgi:hypothetical protein
VRSPQGRRDQEKQQSKSRGAEDRRGADLRPESRACPTWDCVSGAPETRQLSEGLHIKVCRAILPGNRDEQKDAPGFSRFSKNFPGRRPARRLRTERQNADGEECGIEYHRQRGARRAIESDRAGVNVDDPRPGSKEDGRGREVRPSKDCASASKALYRLPRRQQRIDRGRLECLPGNSDVQLR